MNKSETLKDGTAVVVRDLRPDDLENMMAFYQTLPEEDRKYLKVDVTDRDVVRKRMALVEQGNVFRLVALAGKRILADAMLEISIEEWRRHQGELRVIVAPEARHNGLGLVMMRELYFIAADRKVEMVVAKFMRPQEGARRICRRLGFHEESILPDYVKDRSGEVQDLIIMSADMKEFWNDLESFYHGTDWERCK